MPFLVGGALGENHLLGDIAILVLISAVEIQRRNTMQVKFSLINTTWSYVKLSSPLRPGFIRHQ